MKHYDFDEIIERRGTNCVKYDELKDYFGNDNLVPLWVADMDFRTPDFIVDALKKRCEHEQYESIFHIPLFFVAKGNKIILLLQYEQENLEE